MSSRRWFCAVAWENVLLAEELGWRIAWENEHGAWMELRASRSEVAREPVLAMSGQGTSRPRATSQAGE